MNIIYPDYAFATGMQIVLFIVNVTATTLSYYWGANILLLFFGKQVSLGQKLLFSTISAFLLHLLFTYGIAFVSGIVVHDTGKLYIGIFENITKTMNPLSYLILYYLGIRILKMSKYQSLYITQLLYVYYICCWLLVKIAGEFIFIKIADPRGWNYLRDMLAIICGTALTYLLYKLIVYLVNKHKVFLTFPDNIVIRSTRSEIAKNFCISCIVYAAVMTSLYLPAEGYEFVYMLLILLSYLVISVSYAYNRIYKEQIANKDAHIAAQSQSIEEFRGIKHDFNNILQTYSGYLELEEYSGLKQYHKTMLATMAASATSLELSQRMPENPALFSLLDAKHKLALEKHVDFQISLPALMNDVGMDIFDFCRIMAILLDNAIEEAMLTDTQSVQLTCQSKRDRSLLFILSNDTVSSADIEKMFLPGYTTKPDHMGQGLFQVRETLNRYGNCTFNITNYANRFTAYLEVKVGEKALP